MEIKQIVSTLTDEISHDSLTSYVQAPGVTDRVQATEEVCEGLLSSSDAPVKRNKSLLRGQKHESLHQANIQSMLTGSDVPLLEQLQKGVLQKLILACHTEKNPKDLNELLEKAALELSPIVFKYLLDNGADINRVDASGKTLLVRMVERNNLESVKLVLSHRPNLEIPRKDGWTPLVISLTQPRNPEIARLLVEAGANVNARGQDLTALQIAISNGCLFVANMMLSKGAQLNIGCDHSNSPLVLSFKCNPPGIERDRFMKSLVSSGADINYRFHDLETALFHAVRLRDKEAVKFLCAHNASVDFRNSSNITAIDLADSIGVKDLSDIMRIHCKIEMLNAQLNQAVQQRNRGLIVQLLQLGAQIDNKADRFSTPLHKVFMEGDVVFARFLVDQGASVAAANLPSVSELLEGQKYQQPQLLQMAAFLFDFGADVNQCDVHGRPLISVATMMGNADLVDLLMTRHVRVEPGVLIDGMTPLLLAAHFGNDRIVQALLRAHANINAMDKNGHCVLTKVLHKKNISLALHILSYKPVLNVTGEQGCNPLEVAVTLQDLSLVKKMIEQGADVNNVNKQKWAPLMYAIRAKAPLPMIKCLLETGAKVNVKDGSGVSPMSLAIQSEREDIVKLLLEYGANHEPITLEPAEKKPAPSLLIGKLNFGPKG